MKEAKGHEQNANFAQFLKVGDKVEGMLTEVSASEKYGFVYTLEKEGVSTIVVGKTDLNAKMAEVPVGSNVVIELKELIKTKNKNSMKLFKVLYEAPIESQPQQVVEEVVQ